MKKLLPCILILLTLSAHAQQDPLFNQYQFNQLPVNPAYAGVNDITSFDVQYRSQWGAIEGAPSTVLLSGNTSLVGNTVGLGFLLMHDQIGINSNTDFYLSYGYEMSLTEELSLSFGLQTGLHAFQFDFQKLNMDDPEDEDFADAGTNIARFNFGSGVFLSNKSFYLGLSAPRMLKLNETVDGIAGERYNRHYYALGGLILNQYASVAFKPYVVARITENTAISTDVGLNVLLENLIWVGAFTRNFNVLGLSTYLNLSNGLRVGYTGELGSNNLVPGLNSHEITLGLDLTFFSNLEVGKRFF